MFGSVYGKSGTTLNSKKNYNNNLHLNKHHANNNMVITNVLNLHQANGSNFNNRRFNHQNT